MRALVAVVVVVAVSGCRNDVVGEPPLTDAGFEGEGEGAEGEGEGECADADAAVSVHIADDTGFPICSSGAVTLVEGDFSEVATVVTDDTGDCRHEGGFGRPGTYAVTIAVDGFATVTRTATAPSTGDACGNPLTARFNLTLAPQ